MSLESHLAQALVREHPARAAGVLERLGVEEAARALSRPDAAEAAAVLQRMSPQFAAAVLEALGVERSAELLESLPLDVASRLGRRLDGEGREAVLGRLSAQRVRAVRALLRFPENTAGALMDPNVLALPEDLTAKEAFERVRETPEHARYNVYVVDRDQKLVGAVNLRELFLARPRARLADLMAREPLRLQARDDRTLIVTHPGWREVHALPVVDETGAYLGAVRYRTLRVLEAELFGARAKDEDTQAALGQLFAAGAGALLDALASPIPKPGSR